MSAENIEKIEEFLEQAPPRSIPRSIWRNAMKGGMGTIGFLMGIIFLGVGIFFTYMFFPTNFADEFRLDTGSLETINGIVVRSEKTRYSVGGGKHTKGDPVYKIYYRFVVAGRGEYDSECYSVGRNYHAGRKVKVEYLSDNPSVSRIKGAGKSPFGYFGLMTFLFPAVGLVFTIISVKARIRTKKILRDGIFTVGRVADVVRTSVKVNNQNRYRIVVVFEIAGAEVKSSYYAYGEKVDVASEKMDSGDAVGVLYNPDNVHQSILVDSLLV